MLSGRSVCFCLRDQHLQPSACYRPAWPVASHYKSQHLWPFFIDRLKASSAAMCMASYCSLSPDQVLLPRLGPLDTWLYACPIATAHDFNQALLPLVVCPITTARDLTKPCFHWLRDQLLMLLQEVL